MSTTAEKIAVMQAFERGEPLERDWGGGYWHAERGPVWNWDGSDYRIKPKPREWWIAQGPSGNEYVCNDKASAGCFGPAIHVREVLE